MDIDADTSLHGEMRGGGGRDSGGLGVRPFERYAPVLGQFVRFGAVGVSNTLLTLGVYTLLVEVLGVWYLLASALGFAVGAVNGFLLNRSWTFRGHGGDALMPVRWTIVQACGLGLNEALLYAGVHGLHVDELAGQALAIAIVVLATFFANRAWTFRVGPVRAGSGPGSVRRRA